MESPERDRVQSNPSQHNRYQAARDTEPPLTRQESLDRLTLLKRVKRYWVEAVLDKKPYIEVPNIELDLEERLDLVNLPNSDAWETPEQSQQEQSSDTKLIDVFDQMGVGRKLLIVGEPGSAKTTALLKLARILIDRIESTKDFNQPIPVVFNLSSWAKERQPFAEWIVQELSDSRYGFEREVIETWLKNKKLLLLLDGLDEVSGDQRLCIQYLYKFIEQYKQTEIVICCRIQDYEDLIHLEGDRLRFHNAIQLKPLIKQRINRYLDSVSSDFAEVKRLLQEDNTLYELVNTPLMLSVMMRAFFKGQSEVELSRMNSFKERRKHLFDLYIRRMLYRRRPYHQRDLEQPYSTQKFLGWLIWLAKTTQQPEYQPLLIERMQPNLLQPGCQKRMYRFGIFLLSALVAALIYFIIALLFKLRSINLNDGLLYGILIGLIRVVYEKIEPIETLERSPKKIISNILNHERFMRNFKIITISLTISTVVTGLLYPIILQPIKLSFIELISVTVIAYIFSLVLLALIAIIPCLVIGLKGSNIPSKKRRIANLGIRKTIRNTFWFSFIGVCIYSVILIPVGCLMSKAWGISSPINGFAAALMLGLTVGLYPGLVGIQHLMLRVVLWGDESIPLDLVSFLKYAEERIFLQKVGGGYQFIHNLLRDHFAEIDSEEFIKWMEANKHQMSD